ncbi:MAG: ZIP family metal transporter [bacterium]|nr:ZIP family metal transporter [bacterium]
MIIFLIAVATFCATLIGGFFALRLKDRLHLILGFSAGAVIAVAFFDILPEALELAGTIYSVSTILSITAVGFAAYLVLNRLVLPHGHQIDEGQPLRGGVGAGSISLHSFLDGTAIGLAFQVSTAAGAVVAVAVLAHNFSDGINTVGMVLRNGGDRRTALKWLFADAAAPAIGILSTLFFTVPAEVLGLLLALFAGFFLYIGASDLIPESYHAHPVRWTTATTIAGMLALYIVIRLAGV